MTIDPKPLRELADRLAGDVLNQVERDGCLDRGKIAKTLLCGLLLDASAKPIIVDEAFTDAIEDAMTPSPGLVRARVRVGVPARGERVTLRQGAHRALEPGSLTFHGEITSITRGWAKIWYRSDINRNWSIFEIDALFGALCDLQRIPGAKYHSMPLVNLDLVLLPSGELITGLEAMQRGIR